MISRTRGDTHPRCQGALPQLRSFAVEVLRLRQLASYLLLANDLVNVIGATIGRHLRNAKALIYKVGQGRFPDKTRPPPNDCKYRLIRII